MEPIGGYFSLELNDGRERHICAIRLNAGRYALEYILKARGYRKVYLPYFICDSVLQPINRLGVEYEFYHINEKLEPATELHPKDDEAVLYVNYHADQGGIFDYLEIDKNLPAEVVEEDLWVKPGDHVDAFDGANNAIGTLVLKFQTAEELEYAITHQREWLKVVVK